MQPFTGEVINGKAQGLTNRKEENHYKHYDKERKLYHYKCSKCKREIYSWCTDAVGMKCAWCISQMKPVLE